MQKHFLKFNKVLTNIACSPLILISNNSELVAKYLPNDFERSITDLEINNAKNVFFEGFDVEKGKNLFIAENEKNIDQERVLISEIIIKVGKIILRAENLN